MVTLNWLTERSGTLRAKIVEQKVIENALDFVHGGGRYIKRIIVEEKDNLAITPHNNEVYVFTGFNLKKCEVLGEVEVPDVLVEQAHAFAKAKKEFDGLKGTFEAFLEP